MKNKLVTLVVVFALAGCATVEEKDEYVWLANERRSWDNDKFACIDRAKLVGSNITQVFESCMLARGHRKVLRKEFEATKNKVKNESEIEDRKKFGSEKNKDEAEYVYDLVSGSMVVVKSQQGIKSLQGSGVAFNHGVDARGKPNKTWIATNAHLIRDIKELWVERAGKKYPAAVVYVDDILDLGLLLVETGEIPKIKVLGFEHSRIGQRVYAIGSPLGLENTITDGIISGKRTYSGVRVIQTNAPISKGNSGGGLFNKDGSLIGVTTFKRPDGENLNFAIDSSYILNLSRASLAGDLSRIFLDNYSAQPQSIEKIKSYQFTKWLSYARASTGEEMYRYVLDTHDKALKMPRAEMWRFLEGFTRNIFRDFLASEEGMGIRVPK
jgi:S1-C subfamily serine protease